MPRALRIGLPAVLGLLAFALGWAWSAAPALLGEQVRQGLIERAGRRGLLLEIKDLRLQPASQLVLGGVVLRDKAMPDPPLLRVERVEVRYELDGLLSPKVFLQNIEVIRPQLQVRRAADGQHNLQTLIERLLRPKKDDDDEGGGGLRKYLSKHVPPLQVRGLEVALDDESGEPLQVGGLNARQLRLEGGAIDVVNRSPVQEKVRLEVKASVRIRGLDQALRLDATANWPDKTGELRVALPSDVSVVVGDVRVQVGQLLLRSDGEVALGQVRVVKGGAATRYGLDVREIAAKLSKEPGPEIELPPEMTARLPGAARQLLRHVREVVVREPVIVAKRPAALPGQAADDDDSEDGEKAELTKGDAAKGEGDAKDKAGSEKLKADAGKGKLAKGKLPAKEPKKSDPGDGSAVREFLTQLFGRSADRLQDQVDRLRLAMASVPVPVVVVEHGSARFDDQAEGGRRELSDFSGRLDRKPGESVVSLQLSFNTPGRQVANQVSGRFDVRTGDGEVKIQLDDLPLRPYAALLPRSVITEETSAIQGLALSVLVAAPAGKITLEGKGTLREVALEAPRLSRSRVEKVTVGASGKLEVDLKGQRLELSGGQVTVGRVAIELAGSIDKFRSAPVFKAHIAVPTVACQEVVDAVPRGFADTLAGMRCEGRLSYELRGSLDTADMTSLEFDFRPMLAEVKILTLGEQVDFSKFTSAFTHTAVRYIRHPKPGEPKYTTHQFQTGPGTENWVPLDQVNPNFIKVITTTEDGGFFGHRGFLMEAIKSAMVANLRKGRFVRGASTITQQLVKNLFFSLREKTISRKVQEAVITWQIERTLSKPQLMELYLNIIELGPGPIYGIGAASWHYFERAPAELTLLQCLWLGSIIPSPPGYYSEFLNGKASDTHRAMLAWVADVMLKREKITAEERSRLGDCNVVFGGATDGSEEPGEEGLGHEGDAEVDPDLQGLPPGQDGKGRPAPSLSPDQQP